jgi:hypothetical protein
MDKSIIVVVIFSLAALSAAIVFFIKLKKEKTAHEKTRLAHLDERVTHVPNAVKTMDDAIKIYPEWMRLGGTKSGFITAVSVALARTYSGFKAIGPLSDQMSKDYRSAEQKKDGGGDDSFIYRRIYDDSSSRSRETLLELFEIEIEKRLANPDQADPAKSLIAVISNEHFEGLKLFNHFIDDIAELRRIAGMKRVKKTVHQMPAQQQAI